MEYPKTLQSDILQRAFSGKEFKVICDSYNRAKLRSGEKEPTPLQRKYALSSRELGYHEAAKKHKTTLATIKYATQKVTAYDYMNA